MVRDGPGLGHSLEERFRAFERLLENYPANRNQVSYIQSAPATRSGVRAYAEIREALEQHPQSYKDPKQVKKQGKETEGVRQALRCVTTTRPPPSA